MTTIPQPMMMEAPLTSRIPSKADSTRPIPPLVVCPGLREYHRATRERPRNRGSFIKLDITSDLALDRVCLSTHSSPLPSRDQGIDCSLRDLHHQHLGSITMILSNHIRRNFLVTSLRTRRKSTASQMTTHSSMRSSLSPKNIKTMGKSRPSSVLKV